MNISVQERATNRARLHVALEEADYQERLSNETKKAAKTMNVPGFRKGKVPTALVKKMVGPQLRREVITEIVFEEMDKFIKEQELHTILYPIPAEQNTQQLDEQNPNLEFEVALIPTEDMNFDLSGESFVLHEVEVTDEEVDKVLENMREGASNLTEVDTVEEKALLNGTIAELSGDLPKEGGIVVEDALLFPEYMKDKEEQAKFENAGKDSIVIFEPYKAFNGEAGELTSLLNIEREKAEDLKGVEFSYQISKIRVRRPAELDQAFFDQAFGEGVVKDETEAKAKVRELLENNAKSNANFLFAREVMNFLDEERAQKLELADNIILESYKLAQRGKGDEEKEFDHEAAIKSLKEELYIRELAKKHAIEITHDDIMQYMHAVSREQFAQFGWNNPDEEVVKKHAEQLLEKNENYAYNAEMNLMRNKIAEKLQSEVTLQTKKVTTEELNALLSKGEEAEQESAE